MVTDATIDVLVVSPDRDVVTALEQVGRQANGLLLIRPSTRQFVLYVAPGSASSGHRATRGVAKRSAGFGMDRTGPRPLAMGPPDCRDARV